jgi:hypothetical protein
MPAYKRNSDDWHLYMRSLKGAATVVATDVTEASEWLERVAAFTPDRATPLDPEDPENRRQIVSGNFECFVDPRGHLWIQLAALSKFVNVVLWTRVSKTAVTAGLHALGFKADRVQAKVDGKVRQRRFFRSPPDFDVEAG